MGDDRTDGYDVNQRLALLCVDAPDRLPPVTAALNDLGYRTIGASNAEDAIDRLRKESFQVVVVDEAFHGATAEDHPLLHAIQWTPMTARRYMFVALLGADVKTFEYMGAFAASVNLVVNYTDIGHMAPILARAIADSEQFHRVFLDVLREAGKH